MAPAYSKHWRSIPKTNKALRAGLSRRQFDSLDLNGKLSAHLDAWRRITSDEEVLHIVARGLRFELTGSPSLRRRSVQFRCSDAHRAHLRECLAKWLNEGYIERDTSDGLLLSMLFPVPKANGDLRWVMDLTYLNQFVVHRKFKMTSVPAARQLIQQGDYLSSIDLLSAYQQLSIDRRYQHLFGFRADDEIFRWRVGVFGIASLPRLFTRVIKPLMAHLHKAGVRCLAYLDDILIAAASKAESILHTSLTLKLLKALGLKANLDKSELTPTQRLEFLGFRFDTTRWRVSVPFKKLRDLRHQAKQVLRANANGTLTIRRLASLNGKLIAMMPAMQSASFRRHSLSRCIQHGLRRQHRPPESQNWNARISLSRTALRDTKWAASGRARRGNGTPIRRSQHAVTTVTCDASGAGWGGFLEIPSVSTGRPPLRFETSGLWHGAARGMSINWQETTALTLTYQALKHRIPLATREIHFRSDNSTAVSAIRRWGARFRHIGEAIEPLLVDLMQRRVFVSVAHLAGVLNERADALSRRHADLRHEWRMSESVMATLALRFGAPTIDWFAAPGATHAPLFATRFPDSRAMTTDAFSESWSRPGHVQLFVPPFPLLERVVNKIRSDKPTHSWLIVPDWPARPFTALLASLVEPSTWLTLPHDVLVPYSVDYHPMRNGQPPHLLAVPLHTYRQ